MSRGPNWDDHLSPEDIAVLAEGHERKPLDPGVIDHLSRCRSCMSAYADVVRYRAGWLAFPSRFGDGQGPAGAPRDVPAAARPARNRSFWRLVPVGLAAVLGTAATILLLGREPEHANGPIGALLERASAEGLVIPGGEAGAAGGALRYRAGPVADHAAEAEVERLRLEYERDPGSRRNVHRLAAGLLAAGQLDRAGDYIAEGLARAPADPRLMTLGAILAYRRGDPVQAERRLGEVLRVSPGDLTATLDLGLIVAETRGADAARPHFDAVIRRAPRSALADRARMSLDARRPR